jgi:hypothetical protein
MRMWILKKTHHPHPLVVQPRTILVPLLILVLVFLLIGVLYSSPAASKSSSSPAASTSYSHLKLPSS